jgi:pimeloyl-ACP methyl ester carboxylesterase
MPSNSLPIRKHYASLNTGGHEWQIHYRSTPSTASDVRPIILLHPSPLSSAFMEPLLNLLAPHTQAIAWDTPGYGLSDGLPSYSSGLNDYADALAQFIDALKLEKPIIYGSATGAQIGIEFAKAYPDKLSALVLENAASFSDEERKNIVEHYFPDLSPQHNGEHLLTAWSMAKKLYAGFPWFEVHDQASEIPLEIVQKTVLDYLKAGQQYDQAYRAAFDNEKIEQLQTVTIDTHIILWSGSILADYSERLFKAELADNFHCHRVNGDIKKRYQTVLTTIQGLL